MLLVEAEAVEGDLQQVLLITIAFTDVRELHCLNLSMYQTGDNSGRGEPKIFIGIIAYRSKASIYDAM